MPLCVFIDILDIFIFYIYSFQLVIAFYFYKFNISKLSNLDSKKNFIAQPLWATFLPLHWAMRVVGPD